MIVIRKVQVDSDEAAEIICDKCKKSFLYPDGKNLGDVFETQEFHKIRFVGGYGSVFGDGSHVSCDLCQHCLKELISPFVPLKGENVLWQL